MSDPIPDAVPDMLALVDSIDRVGEAVAKLTTEPESTAKILQVILNVLRDLDHRVRVLETGQASLAPPVAPSMLP